MILRRRSLAFATLLSLSFNYALADSAESLLSFRIDKLAEQCSDVVRDNSEKRSCIERMSEKIFQKMRRNVVCNTATCVVRIPCSESKCHGSGYLVTYEWMESGYNIHVELASGNIAEYSQCGTCNWIDPVDDEQIPIALMPAGGYVLLEFEAKYSAE